MTQTCQQRVTLGAGDGHWGGLHYPVHFCVYLKPPKMGNGEIWSKGSHLPLVDK